MYFTLSVVLTMCYNNYCCVYMTLRTMEGSLKVDYASNSGVMRNENGACSNNIIWSSGVKTVG